MPAYGLGNVGRPRLPDCRRAERRRRPASRRSARKTHSRRPAEANAASMSGGGRDGARIHPSAVIDPEVRLAPGVEIGPFCLLKGRVRIGAGTRLISHVAIFGDTEMGERNVLHPNSVIGGEPQDLTYAGGARAVRIGNRNTLREGVTVHRGSERGEITIVGDDNYLMQNAHVAHDCRVGNSTIIVSGA